MATTAPSSKILLLFTTLISLFIAISNAASPNEYDQQRHFSRDLIPSELISGLNSKQEKLTHLHFYFHDIVSGKNISAVEVARAPTTKLSKTGFGAVVMIDDPLTVGPELSSKIVGRAQGMYASADKNVPGFLMVVNFAFTEGEFNGSGFSLLGRNAIFSGIREMSIVGGSGVFRFARGYAQAKTYKITTEAAIVEYNAFVFHY